MTRHQRERMIRLIGYLEGIQYAIDDDSVGEALNGVCETLEDLLKEMENDD